ncbi:hypothetical protein EC957_007511 [Mortierella hygrophila]|uniref:Uncharacterized protein n=1 Tax=Mortierella hygrophila TaxID=979708 RepID=A0A9P6EX23_9FUNG|nr:hypothetical protein EC957_007511 [Mortierella hygrophila]
MANPPPNRTTEVRAYRSKNAKASTEIQEDPELWRDIHNNVRKMDDLYDATFYTWLKSEDNVLVTASYLQRLAGEYDHDRIEHALCWLVHGWRLESIAVLVKQVTFDWIHVHGEQGEKNRARLVLALTDNWAIQYIARLAGTLLTSAATPSPPPTLLTFTPCHSRMASLPGSPVAPPSLTSAAATWGSASPQSSTRPGTTFSQPLSTPSSPRSSHQPLSTFNTPQPTQGRRMAVSRRHGSPMAMPSTEEVTVAAGRPASMSPAAESHASSGYRSNHHRQSSSTLPGHQQHQAHHQLLQQRTSSSSLSSDHIHQGIPPLHPSASTVVNPTSSISTASDALSIAAATPVYPSSSHQQSASYHPHQCNISHHPHHHQHHPPPQPHVLSPQLQHHRQALHRAPVHIARTTHGPHATHVRQSSQPGNVSASKQHWLQQQSSYAASPIFYMNKSLFMEEMSRKWSFCRLSEFFQCLDPASGISHRFKCKLLKESGLKDELSQKQKLSAGATGATATGTGITGKDATEDVVAATPLDQEARAGLDVDSKVVSASIPAAPMDETPSEGSTTVATDSAMDIVMTDSTAPSTTTTTPSALRPSSVVALSSAVGSSSSQPTPSILKDSHAQPGNATMHPLDTPMETVAVTCGTSSSSSSRPPSVSAPIPLVLLQQEQTNASSSAYRPLQSFGHGQQQQHKDDIRSGLNSRGFRNADGNHQHSRAQTVEAIMSKTPATSTAGPSGLTLSPTSSTLSSNSVVSSPMPSPTTSSTMAASASLSNLSLTEQPSMEPTSRPLSQQHNLSPYTTHFSGQSLYRHGAPPHSVPTGSSSAISSSSSTTATSTVTTLSSSSGGILTIHTNGQQQQHQGQAQQSQHQPQRHHPHDSTSAKRKNSLGVSLVNSTNCSSFSSNGSSSVNMHSSSDGSLSSSSAIFPGPRRTSTSASTTNEDLKRLRCSRQNSTSSSASGI